MNPGHFGNVGKEHDKTSGKPYQKSALCIVSEKNWNTNENKDKSVMYSMYCSPFIV